MGLMQHWKHTFATIIWRHICEFVFVFILLHIYIHLNSLYLREDSCKIAGCCSFVEIDVLHYIVLHSIVSSYVSIIVSTIGKTVVKLGFAVPLRCMPRCHAAACSICPWLWDSLRTNGFVYFWDFFCEIRFCISV